MSTDNLAKGLRLLCARQQADTVMLTALLTAHPDAAAVLDHLNRLADADSEHAERLEPGDGETMQVYRDRLHHWIALARHCSAARHEAVAPTG